MKAKQCIKIFILLIIIGLFFATLKSNNCNIAYGKSDSMTIRAVLMEPGRTYEYRVIWLFTDEKIIIKEIDNVGHVSFLGSLSYDGQMFDQYGNERSHAGRIF